ncbi:Hypothetical predicted protein [Podarcis lilfordi]|nr:Hypothetical predicted protein [Podarcis lilfordi]
MSVSSPPKNTLNFELDYGLLRPLRIIGCLVFITVTVESQQNV